MKKIYLFAAAAAVLLTSCGSDTQTIADNGELVPLAISASYISTVKTRSATLLNEGSIGIFLLENLPFGYTGAFSKYSYGTEWAAAADSDIVYLNNKTADLCAYYPYDPLLKNDSAISLISAKYTASKDISFNKKISANNIDASVNFTMDHAYSQIQFDITKDSIYSGTGAVGNISIANAGILKSATLNLWDGAYAYAAGDSATVSYDAAIASIAFKGNVSSNVLMVPVASNMTGLIVFTFIVDGVTMTASMNAADMPLLAAGNVYKVAVTLKGTKLLITSVNVTDWGSSVAGAIVPIV